MSMLEHLESRSLLSVAGALDTTFDGDGRGTVQFGAKGVDTVNASVVQPDGKIVIVGSTAATDGNGTDIAIARLNPDSTLDLSFGESLDGVTPGGGTVIIPLGTASDAAYGVALAPDGGILVAGSVADSTNGFASLAIVLKLTPAGLADPSFGTGVTNGDAGFVFINLSRSETITQSSEARAVALQSDGRIIVAGAAEYDPATGTANFAVTRLNTDGSVDRSFGEFGTGTEVDGVPGVLTEAYGVVVTPDQSILLTGTAIQPGDGFLTPTVGIFVTAKLTRDGIPDNAFGDEAATYTVFPSLVGETVIPFATCLALQPDGKILSAGVVIHLNTDTGVAFSAFGVARYNADGSPDLSFGESGAGYTETFYNLPDGSVANVGANQVVLQPNGKFLVVGRAALTSTDTFSSVALARYNADGTLDTTFNRNGKVLVSSAGSTVATLGLQTAGGNTGSAGAFTSASAAQVAVVPGGGILLLASQGSSLNVTRLIADGPDLIATLTGVKAGSYIGGAKASAKLVIANQGTLASAASVPVTLRLSTDSTYSSDDVFIATVSAKAAVKAGASGKAVTLSFAYPKTGANGQYFVVANVNEARAGAEGNYLNNAAICGVPVTVAPPFADLSASLVLAPAAVTAGKKGVFSVQLVNAGNVVAKGSVVLQLLASLDGAASDDDLRLLPAKATKISVTPGKPLKLKLSGVAATAGTYTLILTADASSIAGAVNPSRSTVTSSSLTVR